jgi:hypothetical protein
MILKKEIHSAWFAVLAAKTRLYCPAAIYACVVRMPTLSESTMGNALSAEQVTL